MSKIVIIIAPVGYQDNEFTVPRDVFVAAGHSVAVASKGVETAVGALGGRVTVDSDISDISDTYDAVVFIGGGGAQVYFNDETAHKLVQGFAKADKVVAAICIAPSTLANAGILSGKRVTAFPTEGQNLQEKGAQFTGTDVEVDGKIVTANGPDSAQNFAEEILKLLK